MIRPKKTRFVQLVVDTKLLVHLKFISNTLTVQNYEERAFKVSNKLQNFIQTPLYDTLQDSIQRVHDQANI